jgi:hypothetical protein
VSGEASLVHMTLHLNKIHPCRPVDIIIPQRKSSVDSSKPLLQHSDIGNSSLNNSNTTGNILLRGIISSEQGQLEQLKVQRTIILTHRQDGNDYTGILTYTASRPVEVLLGHRLGVDNKILLGIDTKKNLEISFSLIP